METTLIIIILLLIGVFNLLTLGVLTILLLRTSDSPYLKKPTEKAAPQPLIDKSEDEAERRKRKAYEDQLSAINEMLNYNSDVAYGIKPNDKY